LDISVSRSQAIVAFCLIKEGHEETPHMTQELVGQVRRAIGPIATPKKVFIVPGLPKTRSGKIMRRILRKIYSGEMDGSVDTTTLADAGVVEAILAKVQQTK
jgi:acetyl-CoA synthetase